MIANDLFNICVVGCGQIGSRYLQGINKVNLNIEIEAIDPNPDSITIAKKRYFEISNKNYKHKIVFSKKLPKINKLIDLLIISTGSNKRKEIIEDILKKRNVKNIIIEKVSFQSISDYESILLLIEKKKINCWINLSYRTHQSYINYKKLLSRNNKINMKVTGNNWGLACNSIHFFDLFEFLTDKKIKDWDNTKIDNNIQKSKRLNYIEFTGKIFLNTNRGDQLTLISSKKSDLPFEISISNKSIEIIIYENIKKSFIKKYENNWLKNQIEHFAPNHSDNIIHIIISILKNQKCNLPSLKTALNSNKILLSIFTDKIFQITGEKVDKCNIT